MDMRNDVQETTESKVILEGLASDKDPTITSQANGSFTVWLIITAITCFLGSSFQFGYNLGVINAPKDVSIYGLNSDFKLSAD